MNIDAEFLPVAKELIDQVFPTAVTYHEHVDGTGSYDPATGTITDSDIDHNINAGVLSRGRDGTNSQGSVNSGTDEAYEIVIWVHHGVGGLQFLPKTSDRFTYDGTVWNVVKIEPTYSSKSLIASKIFGRS